MTKVEKIALLNEMLLIEREESAVTGSRLSIFPFAANSKVTRAITRAFVAKPKHAKMKAGIGAKFSVSKKAAKH